MPIVEALASNTPVLCSDIPVLHEAGGQAANYATVKDPDDFAVRMKSILTTPSIRQQLPHKAARQLATISWQDNVDRLIAAFQDRLDRP